MSGTTPAFAPSGVAGVSGTARTANTSGTSGTSGTSAIRVRGPGDLAACAGVLAAVHAQDGYPTDWPEDPVRWIAQDAPLGTWVATLDGHVAGHIALSSCAPGDLVAGLWQARSGEPPEKCAVVGRLFVSPSARGHGLGARLLDRATEAAHTSGLRPVLDVVATDTAAIALYERLGWRRIDTVRARWAPDRTVTVHCYVGP